MWFYFWKIFKIYGVDDPLSAQRGLTPLSTTCPGAAPCNAFLCVDLTIQTHTAKNFVCVEHYVVNPVVGFGEAETSICNLLGCHFLRVKRRTL